MTCVKVGGWRVTIERGEEKRGEGGKGGGAARGPYIRMMSGAPAMDSVVRVPCR